MGLLGSIFKGSMTASLWTGNAIHTALQNARTKKEIRKIYQNAADANFQNRCVAVLPSVNNQQLPLTSGEPDDNDIYDM